MKVQESISQQLDETLMLAYSKGDASAFDSLYAKHKVAIYRFFVRQNLSVAVAEELCHDTWLKLINNRENYKDNALFTTYLFTIARRVAYDHMQKKSVILDKQLNKNSANDIHTSDVSPLQELSDQPQCSQLNQSLATAIKEQIAALPHEQREVFLLKQEAGFSLDDIAKITVQNKEKVKSSWRYALQKMRKGLSFYAN